MCIKQKQKSFVPKHSDIDPVQFGFIIKLTSSMIKPTCFIIKLICFCPQQNYLLHETRAIQNCTLADYNMCLG